MPILNKKQIPVARKEADELLFMSLRALYLFERSLVKRFDLVFQDIYALQLLRRRESIRVGEIAVALGIPVFSTTRLVQRLEARGLVSKERDRVDRRGIVVRLLPAGERTVDEIEAYNYDLILGTTAGLSDSEHGAFILVAKNLDKALGVETLGAED